MKNMYKVILALALLAWIAPLKADAKTALKDSNVKLPKSSYNYDYGHARKPAPAVKVKGKKLKKGKDYTVSYKNNVNVGTATCTVKGKGKYSGSVRKTFTIKKKSIYKDHEIMISASKAEYSKKETEYLEVGSISRFKLAQKPSFAIEMDMCDYNADEDGCGKTHYAKEGTDFTSSFTADSTAKKAALTITGKGNFTGSFTIEFPYDSWISANQDGEKQTTIKATFSDKLGKGEDVQIYITKPKTTKESDESWQITY